jgi:hypothetical protein
VRPSHEATGRTTDPCISTRVLLDEDPLLRRLERRALAFCLGAALAALVVRGGEPDVALGVLAGGLLMAVSYWAIRSSVTGVVALVTGASGGRPAGTGPASPLDAVVADPSGSRPKKAGMLLRLAGRYALLGLMAYGMIARLRLHPVGLLIGVSSLFAAASLEVLVGRRERRP